MKNKYILLILLILGCKKDVSVNDDTKALPPTPVVSILSPASSIVIGDSVIIQISATDDKGVIKVEVYIDNQIPQGGTLLNSPYTYIWNTESLSDSSVHLLYAKAYDADGNVSSSVVKTIISFRLTPTSFKVDSLSNSSISFSWNDNSSIETGYQIEKSIDSVNYNTVINLLPNTTKATLNETFELSKTYHFRVKASYQNSLTKTSNRVKCFAINTLVVGGSFDSVDNVQSKNIALWNGSKWLKHTLDLPGSVSSLAVYNGSLYAVGNFSDKNNPKLSGIAKLDGNTWVPVGAGLFNPYSIAVFNNELYAGGSGYLKKYDGSNWITISNTTTFLLCVYANELYKEGGTMQISGNNYTLVKYNGTTFSPVGSGAPDGGLFSMKVYNNELIVTGNFTNAGGVRSRYTAKWNGSSWIPNNGIDNFSALSMVVYNNKLLSGATYSNNNATVFGYGLLDWQGAGWQKYKIFLEMSGQLPAHNLNVLYVYNNQLYVGGNFQSVSGAQFNNIMKGDGTAWSALGSGFQKGTVNTMIEYNLFQWVSQP